jgi:uncharacterized protein
MKNLFKTANNNHYLYHSQENKVVFLHPLIDFFSEMEDKGMNPREWIDNMQGPDVNINGLGVFTTEEIQYYFKKYNLFKEKNYFRTVKNENLFQRRLTEFDIENLITSCKDVIFEATEACNLECRYCIGGDLYRGHGKDRKVNIDPDKARLLLKYLSRYWGRPLSPKRIGIKFYGGEPLVNFEAVKEITAYVKTFTDFREKFYFKITTNGVLLDRYLDYLVANNFYIAISLDGDRANNRHRVFANGKPAFEKIIANINLIRDNHPKYFEENVSFQSVHHDLNSITEINDYFQKTYQKRPLMTELTRLGVNQARKKEFDKIYKSIYHNLYHGADYPLLNEKKLNDLPKTPGSGIITHKIYNWLLKNLDEPGGSERSRTPTGTCHPFSRGIFMAADGKILPCERIDHKFALGHIDDDVILDFKAIAERFNRFYDKMNRLCLSCYFAKSCGKCMFNCKVDETQPVCDQYCDQEEFLRKLSDNIGYLEDKPEIYYKHIFELRGQGVEV